ncbi:hypothetical protein LCGC14_2822480 [marine sediment metagenome]|uniref:Uncharacterized protein n=1 Tax=marine sediment metagenome TaxID=412755 RepID=A0A0F8YGE1_9ZZZZ
MAKELTRTIFIDQKVLFGETELTRLIRTLISVYRFRNRNQNPEVIIIPIIMDVDGIKVEFIKHETKKDKED